MTITKNQIQENALKAWIESYLNGYTLMAMGTGKSRLIALAVNYILEHHRFEVEQYEIPVLILVNSEFLRDTELPKELAKWACTYPVKIVCYQTAYKWTKSVGLLIADEFDFALSETEKYMQALVNNKARYLLCMTGTMIEEKYKKALNIFSTDPFYTYTLAQAQTDGLINKTCIVAHKVMLTQDRYQTAPYGEVAKYKWIEGKIAEFSTSLQEQWDLYHTYKRDRNWELCRSTLETIDRIKSGKEYWESNRKNKNSRLEMMWTAQSLHDYALKLKTGLLQEASNKVIIFSELVLEAKKLTPNTYTGESVNNKIIKDFNSGLIRELGVCKKVNRGVNFTGLNHAIVHSFSSSVTTAMQGYVGRLVRLDPSETAYIHVLYSAFIDGDKERLCQNYQWLSKIVNTPGLQHVQLLSYSNGL